MNLDRPPLWHYCLPGISHKDLKIYRYTRRSNIESFFSTGHLRLNSLKLYQAESKLPDEINEEVEDTSEGKAIVINGASTPVRTDFSYGIVNLSTSLTRSDEIKQLFEQADGGNQPYGIMEIHDPIAFGEVIGKKIHEQFPLQQIMIGKCNYVEERTKVVDYEKIDTPLFEIKQDYPTNESEVKELQNVDVKEIIHVYFLKNKQFEHQEEFRYLWKGESLLTKTYIDLDVREAIRFCRLVG